jgi:hypothetical protein
MYSPHFGSFVSEKSLGLMTIQFQVCNVQTVWQNAKYVYSAHNGHDLPALNILKVY